MITYIFFRATGKGERREKVFIRKGEGSERKWIGKDNDGRKGNVGSGSNGRIRLRALSKCSFHF